MEAIMPQTPWIRGCEQCSQLIEENERLQALLDGIGARLDVCLRLLKRYEEGK